MPDILWTGGISELYKISTLAETFYVPVSPHDASGPINILAGAHPMMTVPNFFKLEMNHSSLPTLNMMITEPININQGYLELPSRPGLGVELNEDYLESHLDPDWS